MDLAFFSVHISNNASRQRGSALCWSEPLLTAAEAERRGRQKVAEGEATLAFVVMRQEDGRKRLLLSRTQPPSVRKAIDHYREVLDALEG